MVLFGGGAGAADLPTVRVGKAQALSLAFLPLEIGTAAGIWKDVGINLSISALHGDPQVQQSLTAGSIDVGLGSGPGLGFIAKGVPAHGVAALAGAPDNMALIVGSASTIKNARDLKGRRIAVSGHGSLTDWLVKQVAIAQGWPQDAIVSVPLGEINMYIAALKTGAVDGFVAPVEIGYDLEEKEQGRILLTFGSGVVKDFYSNIIYARDDFITNHPDLLKKFLLGWFRTVAHMQTHRSETIREAMTIEGMSEPAMQKSYDVLMPMLSKNGAFDRRALNHLAASFVDLGILDRAPDPAQLIDPRFVPVHL
jgi:ABC-type nitrate/sulfonate/bicarbonate transport system substrate-binding protein